MACCGETPATVVLLVADTGAGEAGLHIGGGEVRVSATLPVVPGSSYTGAGVHAALRQLHGHGGQPVCGPGAQEKIQRGRFCHKENYLFCISNKHLTTYNEHINV